jgi:hypothetical protein
LKTLLVYLKKQMEGLIFLKKLSFNTNKSLTDKKGHESPAVFAPGISLVIRENAIKLVKEANETCPLLGTHLCICGAMLIKAMLTKEWTAEGW